MTDRGIDYANGGFTAATNVHYPNSKRMREINDEWAAFIGQPIQLERTDVAQQAFNGAVFKPDYTIADFAKDIENAAVPWK